MTQPRTILFAQDGRPDEAVPFAQYLQRQGWTVGLTTTEDGTPPPSGMDLLRLRPHRSPARQVHRFARSYEAAMILAQAFANSAISARSQGFVPDIVLAKAGSGVGTLAKVVWPECRLVMQASALPSVALGEASGNGKPSLPEDAAALALTASAPMVVDVAQADTVLCSSICVANSYPTHLAYRFVIQNDGVDTDLFCPLVGVRPTIPALAPGAELVTCVVPRLTMTDGVPSVLRAFAQLQARRPDLHVILLETEGRLRGDPTAHGAMPLPDGVQLDWDRFDVMPPLPDDLLCVLLQASLVHVCCSDPSALDLTVLPAMAVGVPLVAVKQPPLKEVLLPELQAVFANPSEDGALETAISRLLAERARADLLGRAARARAVALYSRHTVWPKRMQILSEGGGAL